MELINELISKGMGDEHRLQHIKSSLEKNRPLFDSDKNYVNRLIEKLKETPEKPKTENETIEYITCNRCKKSIATNTEFCPKCGVPIKESIEQKTRLQEKPTRIVQDEVMSQDTPVEIKERQPTLEEILKKTSYAKQNDSVKTKDEAITLILAIFFGLAGFNGLGHIYVGKILKGVGIMFGNLILFIMMIATMLVVVIEKADLSLTIIRIVLFIIFTAAFLTVFVWQVFNARESCKVYNWTFNETKHL